MTKRFWWAFCFFIIASTSRAQESYIQVPPDSTGKKLRAVQLTVGANTVYQQGFSIFSTAGLELGLVASPVFVRFTDGAAAYDAAKESGGNLAAIKAKTDNIDVALSTRATETTLGTRLAESTFTGRIGEVQASPTVNTLLGRIKSLEDKIDALQTELNQKTEPGNTQTVSASSLPLPTGAATESTLAGIKTGTDKIPSSPATDRTTAGSPFSMRLSDGTSFYKGTTPSDTQPVSAASLPLPTGAATETTVAGIKTGTDRIPSSPSTDRTTAGGPNSVRLSDGSAFYKGTTPADTQPISAASLPLPTGAAQEHTAAATPSSTRLSDGSAFYKATTPADTQPISASSLPLPAGAATETTLAGIKTGTDKIPASPSTDRTTAAAPFSTRLSDGSAFYKATTPADTQPISASSLPLPSGAATESTLSSLNAKDFATSAKQDIANTSLASVDTKMPALVNSAQPVVIMNVATIATPPVLNAAQLSNQLLYRAAMQQFCRTNLCK